MKNNHFSHYTKLLQEPASEAKGFTRWWWYGSAVTETEIERELIYMHDAGLGGVELQVTYPMQADDPELGIKNNEFFSPRFFELLEFTLSKAEELGLWVDFTLGSGWPFGGAAFVTYDMAPEVLLPYQIDLIGPTTYQNDFTTILAGTPYKAVIGKFENGRLLEETMLDVSDKLDATWLYGWQWGHRLHEIEIPEGHWKLYIFVVNLYKQTTGRPTLGMEGYAIDHCRADVVDQYFTKLGDPLVDKLGEGRIRAFFCDSIELGGNNWTSILIEEFAKRRGYDLTPYMPALWGEIGDITPNIRFDYYKTFSELTIENFFRKFTEWSHSRGSKSRIQAHGTWGDILQAYAAADFPEGETFGSHDKYEVNTIHRRLASSAGHLYGRKVITNETFTWLRSPRFMETLEMMKAAVDAVFLDGINHIVNHGYSYSPESVGKPGWVFYASSFISHNNTWWEYYPELSHYIHTVSGFLQQGSSFAEIGIYLPQSDIWSSMPMAELHMAMKLEEYMGRDFVNKVQKQGYYFDYLNDEAIEQLSTIDENGLNIEASSYKVIILPRVTRMDVAVAERLKKFVEKGGILISLGLPPAFGCGLLDRVNKAEQVKIAMDEIFAGETRQWNKLGDGKAIIALDEAAALEYLTNSRHPMVKITADSSDDEAVRNEIGFVHRKRDKDDIYFVSNISKNAHAVSLIFAHSSANLIVMDAMQRQIVRKTVGDGAQIGTPISIHFEPYQSYFFIFSPEAIELDSSELAYASLNSKSEEQIGLVDISQNWELIIDELQLRESLVDLTTWEQFDQARYYTGAGFYEKTITVDIPQDAKKIYLQLENVHEVAEIFINGVAVGTLWKAPRKLEISAFLFQGSNDIRIKVVNLWINHVINPATEAAPVDNSALEQWPYFGATTGKMRNEYANWEKEKAKVSTPFPSGLSGSVKLEFVR